MSGICAGLIMSLILVGWHYNEVFYLYDKFFQDNESILQQYNAAEREEIWKKYQAQKELTDFADKRKEMYKKTHRGY